MNQPFFRQLGVSLRDHLCDVALFMPVFGYYVSAQSLDSLDLTKNRLLLE
jgi:hypothetical protein